VIILAVNAGSSSVKLQVIDTTTDRLIGKVVGDCAAVDVGDAVAEFEILEVC